MRPETDERLNFDGAWYKRISWDERREWSWEWSHSEFGSTDYAPSNNYQYCLFEGPP